VALQFEHESTVSDTGGTPQTCNEWKKEPLLMATPALHQLAFLPAKKSVPRRL
jgi:hypothetical protein